MARHHVRDVHQSLEVPGWAPWLRFGLDEMLEYQAAFPEGQIVHLGEDGRPAGALTSICTSWSGDPAALGTWDAVSGHDTSIRDAHDPRGDTLVMLSVSVHPAARGTGVPAELVRHARRLARERGLSHLISPFRPSGFGAHKAAGGDVDFAAYCASERHDGLPQDPWLRALTRLGMRPLRIVGAAMVARATTDELDRLRREHTPDSWIRMSDHRAEHLVAGVSRELVGEVDEVWECGETGSWFVDRGAGRATYVESNLWGELPITERIEANDDDVVVDVTDAAIARHARAVDDEAERRLIAELADRAVGEPMAVGWIDPDHPHADVVRAHEVDVFPDIEAFMTDEVDAQSRFLVVVDLREDGRLVHAFRVSSPRFGPADLPSGSSGLPMVDEVVEVNSLSLDDVRAHYAARGTDIGECIAVETNFRIGGGVAPNGLRWSDVGYIAVFLELMRGDDTRGERGVFAHLNEAARRSLGAIGVTSEPFGGDAQLRSPASQEGAFDDRYSPSFIPDTDANVTVFRSLEPLGASEIRIEAVIDLRDAPSDGAGRQAVQQGELQRVDGRGGDRQVPDEAG